MPLPSTVQGSHQTVINLAWLRPEREALDLTSGSLTGSIRNVSSGVVSSIAGTLTITNATAGRFTWVADVDDMSTAGNFLVQFHCTYPDATVENSIADSWLVYATLTTMNYGESLYGQGTYT